MMLVLFILLIYNFVLMLQKSKQVQRLISAFYNFTMTTSQFNACFLRSNVQLSLNIRETAIDKENYQSVGLRKCKISRFQEISG